jgi:hypothetical protein
MPSTNTWRNYGPFCLQPKHTNHSLITFVARLSFQGQLGGEDGGRGSSGPRNAAYVKVLSWFLVYEEGLNTFVVIEAAIKSRLTVQAGDESGALIPAHFLTEESNGNTNRTRTRDEWEPNNRIQDATQARTGPLETMTKGISHDVEEFPLSPAAAGIYQVHDRKRGITFENVRLFLSKSEWSLLSELASYCIDGRQNKCFEYQSFVMKDAKFIDQREDNANNTYFASIFFSNDPCGKCCVGTVIYERSMR